MEVNQGGVNPYLKIDALGGFSLRKNCNVLGIFGIVLIKTTEGSTFQKFFHKSCDSSCVFITTSPSKSSQRRTKVKTIPYSLGWGKHKKWHPLHDWLPGSASGDAELSPADPFVQLAPPSKKHSFCETKTPLTFVSWGNHKLRHLFLKLSRTRPTISIKGPPSARKKQQVGGGKFLEKCPPPPRNETQNWFFRMILRQRSWIHAA